MDSPSLVMEFFTEVYSENQCSFSILACVFVTVSYVASLYVWRSNLSRDHPTTIKRRFFSVFCMMILAPFFCYYFMSEESLKKGDMLEQLGLRFPGILQACVLPLFLTAVLFLGPFTMQYLSGIWTLYADIVFAYIDSIHTPQANNQILVILGQDLFCEPMYWLLNCQDLVWVRNYVMAPLSEEWVFRACMIPLLLQCVQPMVAVFVGPLLFGIAHFHHMFEQVKSGFKFKTALTFSLLQFGYTSIFGVYSAFIFVRTGHFVAPLLAHMFCNHMGFPNFGEIFQYPTLQKVVIIVNFILGLSLWWLMLFPLTDPALYENKLHYET